MPQSKSSIWLYCVCGGRTPKRAITAPRLHTELAVLLVAAYETASGRRLRLLVERAAEDKAERKLESERKTFLSMARRWPFFPIVSRNSHTQSFLLQPRRRRHDSRGSRRVVERSRPNLIGPAAFQGAADGMLRARA